MRFLLCMLAVLFFPVISNGDQDILLDDEGEVYELKKDLSIAYGDVIVIAADNVTINGMGHTLLYCQQGPGAAIRIKSEINNLIIKNIKIVQGDYNPKTREHCHGVHQSGNMSNIKLINNYFSIKHSGKFGNSHSYGVYLSDYRKNSVGNIISGNVFDLAGTSATRGISISSQSGRDVTWDGEITDNKLTLTGLSSNHGRSTAIAIFSKTNTGIIRNNSIVLKDSKIVQAMSFFDTSGWKVQDNVITDHSYYSRSILLDNADNMIVENNRITMTYSGKPTGNYSTGIRVRFGSDNNVISGNEVIANGTQQIAFRIGGTERYRGHDKRPRNNKIINNKFVSTSRAVSIEEGSYIKFSDNIIRGVGSQSFPVIIMDLPKQEARDIIFNRDKIYGANSSICGNKNPCKVRLIENVRDLLFCNVFDGDTNKVITKRQISEGLGSHSFLISSSCK